MSEEVIANFIEKLKKENPSIGFLVDNKDIFQIFNNMEILSLIIDEYDYIIDKIFFILENSTIEDILLKYPHLNKTFFHHLKDDDERLKLLNKYLDIDNQFEKEMEIQRDRMINRWQLCSFLKS